MYKYLDFVIFFIYGVLGFIGIGILMLFIMRLRNIQREQQRTAIFTKYRSYFTYLQHHIEDDDSFFCTPEGLKNMRDTEVIQDQLIEWMGKLRGEQQIKLTRLCEDMGLVKKDIKLLDTVFYAKRMQAAFRLGGMRSALAIPKLLELMVKEKDQEMIRVIARAIARCAEDVASLITMLRRLLQCEQINQWFAATLLEESSLDATSFLIPFLEEDNLKLVKTALLDLNRHTHTYASLELTSSLFQLADSQDRDIRALAIKVLIRISNVITEDVIRRWLSDPEWQVRVAVTEALASFHNPVNILLLKEALTDCNWQVCYSSSKSLAVMGDEGFRVLCEAALERDDTNKSDIAKNRIQEELLREHYIVNHCGQKSTPARKRLLYEQYFAQTCFIPLR